jgi:hypothetical protein
MKSLKPVLYLIHHSVRNISRRLLLWDDITAIVLNILLALVLIFPIESSSANVITDWDMKAVAVAAPAPSGTREMAIVHVAMFDAVNSSRAMEGPTRPQPSRPLEPRKS